MQIDAAKGLKTQTLLVQCWILMYLGHMGLMAHAVNPYIYIYVSINPPF